MTKLKEHRLSFNLGPIKTTSIWIPDEAEQRASWEMYVELITRAAVQEPTDNSLLREALTSLYTLFDRTRIILRKYGPDIAIPKEGGTICFGLLSITILNDLLRPFLSKWHPLLLEWESRKEVGKSPLVYEKEWDQYEDLVTEYTKVREKLTEYSRFLAEVAGIESRY